MSKSYKKKEKEREKKRRKERAKKGYAYSDVWDIQYWFVDIMPRMLTDMKKGMMGHPAELDENGNDGHAEWERIIDKMIFLLHEMNEETCSQKNEYEDRWWKDHIEFEKKYGLFGKKLCTKEEKETEKKTHFRTMHFPSELPEYKETSEKFLKREEDLAAYRDKCKNEFFELFSRYFWNLWD